MPIIKYIESALALVLFISISCSSPKINGSRAIQSQDTIYFAKTEELKSNHIPDYVFDMHSLKQIIITGMDCDYGDHTHCWEITEIPPEISKLKNLTTLVLNVNAIQTIPIELAELKNLKELDLTDNPALTSVDNVEKISGLEHLSLYGCGLKKMPEKIGDLKKLKELGLVGNNIDKQEQKRIKEALPDCIVRF